SLLLERVRGLGGRGGSSDRARADGFDRFAPDGYYEGDGSGQDTVRTKRGSQRCRKALSNSGVEPGLCPVGNSVMPQGPNGDGERDPAQQGFRDVARQLWGVLQRSLFRPRGMISSAVQEAPGLPKHYEPLRRVLLTDGVGRTLFEEFAAHREAEHGDEET